MELKDFGKLRAWVDEAFLVFISNIEKVTESGNIPITILNEGLAGFTDGSGSTTINFTYYVPRTGFEFNFEQAVEEKGIHSVQLTVSGHNVLLKGKFMTSNISQSTDQAVTGTASFMGSLKALK
jgi:hypothetical protein